MLNNTQYDNMLYTTCGHISIAYDTADHTIAINDSRNGCGVKMRLCGLYRGDEPVYDIARYGKYGVVRTGVRAHRTDRAIILTLSSEESGLPPFTLKLSASPDRASLNLGGIHGYSLRISGTIYNGSTDDCFAVCMKELTTDAIRCAYGPYVSVRDNAIYNRQNDTAYCIEGTNRFRMNYDYASSSYGFTLTAENEGVIENIVFRLRKNILADKYGVDFHPLKKRANYTAPPSGWMTWYAVKFDACEKAVLDNARFQAEQLKPYGADTVWVDWEWYHKDFVGNREDGVNVFKPDPVMYPNGMKYVADEIRKMGLIPAIWIGFTNDPSETDYEKEHPDIRLVKEDTWCGNYYYDFSHPDYLGGFLEKAVGQIKEWGYEAVKYDTLPMGIGMHERFHNKMYDPSLTTYEAYRTMIERVRDMLGEDCFMVSCGSDPSQILWGSGVFDMARIGPDLFTWENFLENLVRLREYYPLHNTMMINDPDNVVLRDEFCDDVQAVTRVSLISLLGLPLTFGDVLSELPSDRIELIKRSLPVMNVHPTEFNNAVSDGRSQVICQAISLPFEDYVVAAVLNLTEEEILRDISLGETLRLDDGEYLMYDYFGKRFMGVCRERVEVAVKPFGTTVFALRRRTGIPQIVSTSRHITQGAAELADVKFADDTLTVRARLVKGDKYTVTVYIPDGYAFEAADIGDAQVKGNILTLDYIPENEGEYTLKLYFKEV